jgi:hypothetical protein
MKDEMDLMRMDERQRLSWLRANRATLMVVGVVWLLMIGWELIEGRTPRFLIMMVPVFAAVRFGLYWFYARDRDVRWRERLLFFVFVAIGHWVATVVANLGEFATGGWLGLFHEPGHGAWRVALRILEFPLLTIARLNNALATRQYGWLMVLNSLAWAGVIYVAAHVARRGRRAEPDEPGEVVYR